MDKAVDEQPWLKRKKWASGKVYSDARKNLWFTGFFALVWNVIALTASFSFIPEIQAGNASTYFVLIFPIIGICMLWWVVEQARAWLKFGKTPITLDPFPGSIGGQVGGTLEVGQPFRNDLSFKVVLTCVYSYKTGSGKNRRRTEDVVWQSEGFAYTSPGSRSTRLEFLFDVDPGLPDSNSRHGSSYHLWRLSISCPMEGSDFERDFELPVYPTAESASRLTNLSVDHRESAEQRYSEIESVLQIQQISGGVRLLYPAFRKLFGKLILTSLGAAGLASGSFFYFEFDQNYFLLLFVLVGGLLAAWGLYKILLRLEVVIDAQQLEVRKSILGLPIGVQTINRRDVVTLKLKKGHSESMQNQHTQYFKILAKTTEGKSIVIGFNFAGREVAKHALESIVGLTGLPADYSIEY